METGSRRPAAGITKLAMVALLGAATAVTAVTAAAPASASSGIGVYVAYADSLRAEATNFPTPWFGSPNTIFEGCNPVASCTYDAGAVRIVNNSGAPVFVSDLAVHVSTCVYTGWANVTLPAGDDLIVTQLDSGPGSGCTGPSPAHLDTSDVGPNGSDYSGNCTPDGIQPEVDVTIDGNTTKYFDSGRVLNTGGFDATTVCGFANESIQWTIVGTGPCRGSALALTPPSQTHGIGQTATVAAIFTNSCGQPLSDVAVNFLATAGPNAALSGSGATDASGHATFMYSSAKPGTDTWQASITNVAGKITSNNVSVTWIAFAPGGGGFVIGDLENIQGGSAYWWGAQWWKNDHLSSGVAPASFKGFENSNATPWCGGTWTARPGNSSRPPQVVAAGTEMAVIVSSHITKRGPTISGNIVHIVVVRTNAGYGPNPGHRGTGTIVATLC